MQRLNIFLQAYGPETITLQTYSADTLYMVYVYDYKPDPNHTLSASMGKVYVYPSSANSIEVSVPSQENSQLRYWLVGCFSYADQAGVTDFKIVNEILETNPNSHPDLCLENQQ